MKYGKWVRSLTFVAAFGALCFQSCRKENGIDNNNVIRTPYSLYYGDVNGGVESTNDGQNYKRVFDYDGIPVRAIVTSGTNVLFVKNNVHLSTNDGQNFNPTDFTANPYSIFQSVILDVTSHGRLYVCSTSGQGIKFSEDHGQTWKVDANWDPNITGPAFPTSLTQLKGGDLFGYSSISNRLFTRTSKDNPWVEVTVNGLPASYYFLSRLNDALIASNPVGGVYFSNDKGRNWTQYSGLSTSAVNDTYAPFDQTLLVATDNGVYRLVSGAFISSSNGFAPSTVVYSITAKSDTYKNEVIKQYVYAGTSTGLYRSEDLGQNWVNVKDGDIRRVY